ncbi:MAG: hypothetical protein ACOYMN_22695 [Roseimicrobium sp.]
MTTMEADVELSSDGSLKLLSPLPAWWKPGRAHVKLMVADAVISQKVTEVTGDETDDGSVLWAMKQLRKLGGLRDVIPDAAEWQREVRRDRPLTGRED